MRKRVVAKGNMRRGDVMRAVITDTLPEEVPIVFSNDGFYLNITKSDHLDQYAHELVEKMFELERPYAIPYRYNVIKDAVSTRQLSLLHPNSQRMVANFYSKYDSLICHFVRKSPASLRSPHKVGGTFYVKGPNSDQNRLRRATVDTVSIENSVSNPASYFSYNKINRAHLFFDSNEYLHLEKKFQVFRSIDISKCFSSIYTHTLFWAVADVQTAKDNTSSSGFANEFDRLMQSMNFNETNGICVGPEVSRVFAEIILSEIDSNVVSYLSKRECNFKVNYEFRRYVDDYYIFAQDHSTADRVSAAVEHCLGKFNLHVNAGKTETIVRPFVTSRSQVISGVDAALATLFEKFISYKIANNVRFAFPKAILRSDALFRSFVKTIKSECQKNSVSYHSVSDYVVSAFTKRVVELESGFSLSNFLGDTGEREYVSAIMLLLELSYYFYTVNPTVRASLNLARTVVIGAKLIEDNFPDRLPFLSESVVRWTLDLARSINHGGRHKDLTAIPIEVLNILIPMRGVAGNEPLIDELVGDMCKEVENFEYFEIVSFLYVLGGRSQHRALANKLFVRAKKLVSDSLGPRVDAQSAHLSLDLLCCPFLPLDKRASWFNTLRSRCGLARVSRVEAQAAVLTMEPHPWFVRWQGVSLLSILRKKELSAVY